MLNNIEYIANNIYIRSVSAYKNNISITLLHDFDVQGDVSLFIFDRNENILISEQEIEFIDSRNFKILLDDESISSMLENSALNHVRLCVAAKNGDELTLYFIKKTDPTFFNTNVCTIAKYSDSKKHELLLYYSMSGLLSVKVVRTNKVLFDTTEQKGLIKNNIKLIKFNLNKIEFSFEQDVPEYQKIELLFINKASKKLTTSNVIGSISGVKKVSNSQYKIYWNLADIVSNPSNESENFTIALYVKYEDHSDLVLLCKEDTITKERMTYDLRKNFNKSININANLSVISYFSEKGLSVISNRPVFDYKEQITTTLTNLTIEDDKFSISIRCKSIKEKYTGLVIYNMTNHTEKFVPYSKLEKNKFFNTMSVSITEENFREINAGNYEIFSVFENDEKNYYIPIIATNTFILANPEELILYCSDAKVCACISSKNKLYFKKSLLFNPFGKKNVQETLAGKEFEEILNNIEKIRPIGKIHGEIVSTKANTLTVNVFNTLPNVSNIAVVILNEEKNIAYTQVINTDETNGDSFDISMECMQTYLPDKDTSMFRICLLAQYENSYFYLRLFNYYKVVDQSIKNDFFDRRSSYYPSVADIISNNETFKVIPYYAMNGALGFYVAIENLMYMGQLSGKFDKVELQNGILKLSATCYKLEKGNWIGFKLNYRYKIKEDSQSYTVNYSNIEETDEYIHIDAEISIKELNLKMIFWDITCAFELDNKEYEVKLFCTDDKLSKQYEEVHCKDQYIYKEDNSILYPYITKTNSVALAHREYYPKYDTAKFRLKERKALNIYNKHKEKLDNENIYLIYEKYCTAAQDNGYFFFLYCMEHNVEKEIDGHIYYVIDKTSKDYKNIEKYDDHVLDFMSLKHMVYLLASKMLISTDTKEHSYVYRAKGSILLPEILKKEYIFLQHGVIALKKIDHVYGKGKFGQCKRFVVSSNYEKGLIKKYFKYDNEEIITTGLARWDVLEDKSAGKRKMMIVPTWRSWLDDVENDTFVNSMYFKRYMELLNDKRLYDLLEAYDVTCDFYIHIKFKDYIHNFDSRDTSRVRLIVFGEHPLNELLMECKLLITDYSSVSWDIYYQSKPVIFYQFDINEYLFAHGSYMNLETDLFGDRTEDLDTLFELLEDYFNSDFELKPKYAATKNKYFKFIDNNNSKRIWNAIKKIHFSEIVKK